MSRLISPIARVSIGKGDTRDLFMSGDGILRHVSVTLGEDARATNCRFELYDPQLLIADKYFKMSFEQGGIEVPADLLSDPSKDKAGGTISDPALIASLGAGGDSSVADATQTPEIKAWLDTIAWCEGTSGADGYTTQFTGSQFTGFARHPREIKCSNGLCSDASGRYQFLSTTWEPLGLPDFSPANQDKGAVQLLKDNGALGLAQQGESQIPAVCNIISHTWASIPPYRYPGQGSKTLADITAYWKARFAQYNSGAKTPAQAAAATQPTIQDKASSKPVEVSNKGTEIIIELGYQLDQMVAYHFIHIGTSTQGRSLDSTVFEGQSIRWLMTRRTKNTAYGNLTLRKLAEQVAKSYGFTLEMEGDGPTYQYLDQTGITDYELLLREARAIGYSIRESGNQLVLKPWRPEFTGFVITADILQNISFSDKASQDRSPATGTTTSTPSVPAADFTTKINRLTGQIEQSKVEDTTAAGTATTRQPATTGAATPPLTGTPAPESAAKPASGLLPEATTGLPNQDIGAIDLADGRAEAKEIKDESRRVRGYESQATLITTPELLSLAPGSIIGISRNIVPETFAREWRVGSVTHTLQGGSFRSQLSFYTPQAMKADSKSGGGTISDPALVASLGGSASSTGWASPMPIEGNSSCGPICEFGNARGRFHMGLDFGGYGSGSDPDGVFAASDGVVAFAAAAGSYGNLIEIKRSDGWFSRYAHLAKMDVATGAQVKQGQRVGTRGATGGDLQIHLHFEIRDPGSQPHNPREFLPKPQIPGG